jgi:hypothetical protein
LVLLQLLQLGVFHILEYEDCVLLAPNCNHGGAYLEEVWISGEYCFLDLILRPFLDEYRDLIAVFKLQNAV